MKVKGVKWSERLVKCHTCMLRHKLSLWMCVLAIWWSSCSPDDSPYQDMGFGEQDMGVVEDLDAGSQDDGLGDMREYPDLVDLPDLSMDLEGVDMGLPPYVPPELTETQQATLEVILESFKQVCELHKQCFPVFFDQSYLSIDECIQHNSDYSYLRHEMPALSVTTEQAQVCLQEWTQAECSDLRHLVDIGYKEACQFTGAKPAGERCVHHMACESGFCSYGASAWRACLEPAVCVAPFEEGERPCGPPDFQKCPPRMKCVRIDGVRSCRARLQPFESDCRVRNNGAGACDGMQFYCDSDDGICKPRPLEGEPCDGGRCFVIAQLECPITEDNPICRKIPDEEWFLLEGAPCLHKDHRCIPGTICAGSGGSRFCQIPLEEGDPCDDSDACPLGTLCNTELGFCETRGFTNKCLMPEE